MNCVANGKWNDWRQKGRGEQGRLGDAVMCAVGARRGEGGRVQGLLIMIKILSFTLNEMGSV